MLHNLTLSPPSMSSGNVTQSLSEHLVGTIGITGITIVSLCLVILTGCSPAPKQQAGDHYESDHIVTHDSASAGDTSVDTVPVADDSDHILGSQVTHIKIAGKQLVLSARATFDVKDVIKTRNAIETLTKQQGGYIAQSDITNDVTDYQSFVKGDNLVTIKTYYRRGSMLLRIPTDKMSYFLQQLQPQITFLSEQSFTAEDVTLDLYQQQLEARLHRNLAGELTQQRLDSDNGEDQSSNIDAITTTYDARLREDYAKLQQMQIEDRIKYSTIALSFSQPAQYYQQTQPNIELVVEALQPSFATQAGEAIRQGWLICQQVLLGIIRLWWLWGLLLFAYSIFLSSKSLYRKYKTKAEDTTR